MGVIIVICLAVVTGLSIWKPVQLGGLTGLFGGYPVARTIHLTMKALIVGFLIIHLALVILSRARLSRCSLRFGPSRTTRHDEACDEPKKRYPACQRHRTGTGAAEPPARSYRRTFFASPDSPGVDAALSMMLEFDDRVQAALFNPNRLAETYPASAITKPFRFNAYYPEWQIRTVPAQWRLEVSGLVSEKIPRPWPACCPRTDGATRPATPSLRSMTDSQKDSKRRIFASRGN
jgi:hypothetical protein